MTRRGIPIFMYHSVAPQPNDATHELSVSPEAFGEQMEVLRALGCTPLTTAQLAWHWRNPSRPLPTRPVLITFDDGYEGVHRHAMPVLAKQGFASTLFIATGWLRGTYDTGGGLDTMLTWDQVRDLAESDVEIGGHSHTHPQLDQLSDDALWFEVIRCKEILAAELGSPPVSFAYPYGYSSRRVRRTVRGAGFCQSLAVGNTLARRGQGPYALRRVTVRRSTGPEEFERLAEGRSITRTFAGDRVLTKGYAIVRRCQQARRKAARSRV